MKIASTMAALNEPAWRDVTVIDVQGVPVWKAVRNVIRAARSHDALVLSGAARWPVRYRDFIAALILARRRNPPAVVFNEAIWDYTVQPLQGLLGGRVDRLLRVLMRAFVKAFDGEHVTYCALAEAEKRTFSERFGIPTERVIVTYYPYTLFAEWHASDGDYVFAGGDSRRDYGPVLEAARQMPERRFVIATRLSLSDVPANVTARATSPEEFVELQSGAGAVIVALDPSVRCSAGQQSYLNAMLQGKPTLVTDAVGVREYIDDGVDGWVVAAEAHAIRERLEWIFDERNRASVAAVREQAPKTVLGRFNPEQYWWAIRRAAEATAPRIGRL
jgi:glycosyltransferase involved in cell wall biosynthesis